MTKTNRGIGSRTFRAQLRIFLLRTLSQRWLHAIKASFQGCLTALLVLAVLGGICVSDAAEKEARLPANDAELQFWLENMLVHHRFRRDEVTAATGLSELEIEAAVSRLGIDKLAKTTPAPGAALLVLPYPGGRHPRVGFLEGAIGPQRETKLSVFAPWKNGGYAVADIPEAIWWQGEAGRELLYLAHTHVPTVWTKQGVTLQPLEWSKTNDGWQVERTLPNQVTFGTRARTARDHVRMEMWLTNGTDKLLRGLVVQNCVMLKGLAGFDLQTNDNKVFQQPYAACHNADKTRWIIAAWQPCQRAWGNAPCPCLHSDPKFPDCEPGKTVRLQGWLSFYEGSDIDGELKRIDQSNWGKEER
jgi:hypothetical protein